VEEITVSQFTLHYLDCLEIMVVSYLFVVVVCGGGVDYF